MDTRNTPDPEPHTPPQTPATGGLGRRQLLRGAAASAPVMLTVKSKTALAGGFGHNNKCATASGFHSLNASAPGKNEYRCSGRPPKEWRKSQNFREWPSGCKPKDPKATKFKDIFLGYGFQYGDAKLVDVLELYQHNDGTVNCVAAYLCAAVLNARKGLTPPEVLSEATAKSIWQSLMTQGYYEPSAGVRWQAAQITQWLKSTMTL